MDASSSNNSDKPLQKDSESSSMQLLKHTPKVFKCRKPLLEQLYEKGDLPLYHFIPVAIFAFSVMSIVLYFYIYDDHEKHFEFILSYMKQEYENFPLTFGLNVVVVSSVGLIGYFGFTFWKSVRTLFENKSYVDKAALVSCAVFYYLIFTLPFRCVDVHGMPLISKTIFAIMQGHIFMKVHAFIRENIPHVLYYDKIRKDHGESKCWQPSFGSYFFFIRSPTYIYRDSYPRNKDVDWVKFCQYSFSMFCSIWLPMIPIVLLVVGEMFKCESQYTPLESVGHTFLILAYSGYVEFIMSPYGMFHCLFNVWAEAMGFADRSFYVDWWNVRSSHELSRKWTFVLHEWLHFYIYLDCRNVLRLSKRTSAIITYALSAIAHDYVFAVGFGFTLPMLTLGVLIFLVILPSTFERKHSAPQERKNKTNIKVYIGFGSYFFFMVYSYYIVVCRNMKCSQGHEASWTNVFFSNVAQC